MPSYGTRVGIEDVYGGDNVAKWADLNNNTDQVEIGNRIDVSLEKAYTEINARLLQGPYTIPFPEPVPTGISDLAEIYAGYWLYSNRAINDEEEDGTDVYSRKINEFNEKIRDILYGRYKPAPVTVVSYPQVITDG